MIEARPDCKADSTGYDPATGAERFRRPRHFRTQIAAKTAPRPVSAAKSGCRVTPPSATQQILLGDFGEDFQMPGSRSGAGTTPRA